MCQWFFSCLGFGTNQLHPYVCMVVFCYLLVVHQTNKISNLHFRDSKVCYNLRRIQVGFTPQKQLKIIHPSLAGSCSKFSSLERFRAIYPLYTPRTQSSAENKSSWESYKWFVRYAPRFCTPVWAWAQNLLLQTC